MFWRLNGSRSRISGRERRRRANLRWVVCVWLRASSIRKKAVAGQSHCLTALGVRPSNQSARGHRRPIGLGKTTTQGAASQPVS